MFVFMGSTEAILSAQMASKCFSVSKFMTSPMPQMQKKQSDDGSSSKNAGASGSSKRLEQKEIKNSAAKIVGKHLKPRFALELDGLHCFETLVPL